MSSSHPRTSHAVTYPGKPSVAETGGAKHPASEDRALAIEEVYERTKAPAHAHACSKGYPATCFPSTGTTTIITTTTAIETETLRYPRCPD